jgi:hypothetical protein
MVIYEKEWKETKWKYNSTSQYQISLRITINFPSEKIKILSQHQDYTLGNFGAEVGGYVGMLLGYSLLQLPSFIKLVDIGSL